MAWIDVSSSLEEPNLLPGNYVFSTAGHKHLLGQSATFTLGGCLVITEGHAIGRLM